MKGGGVGVQALGVGFVACVALLAALYSLRSESGLSRLQLQPPPGIVVDVLKQEAAVEGKTIHVRSGGKELLQYVCKPDDAAIAVFTMRDKRSGGNLLPSIASATDPQGYEYATQMVSNGFVSLVTIKRGFAQIPSSIEVKAAAPNMGFGAAGESLIIKNIAMPRISVPTPTPQEALPAERLAKALMNDRTGDLSIVCIGSSATNSGVFAEILDSSYGARSSNKLPTSARRCLQSVKVRLCRYRFSHETATLGYRDAVIMKSNGKSFLFLSKEQQIGNLLGHQVLLTNRIPSADEIRTQDASRAKQEIQMVWAGESGDFVRLQKDGFDGTPVGHLELTEMSPSVEYMGLDSLRVVIRPMNAASGRCASEHTFYPNRYPANTSMSSIPELKFQGLVTKYIREGSQTVILPVHHFSAQGSWPASKGAERS